MKIYAIKNNKTGLYVSKPGRGKSYTNRIEYAQLFRTLEDAKKDCCGNEYLVEVSSYIHI